MSIYIADKPEMNVVNVGDELTQDQIEAIQNGINATESNHFQTLHQVWSTGPTSTLEFLVNPNVNNEKFIRFAESSPDEETGFTYASVIQPGELVVSGNGENTSLTWVNGLTFHNATSVRKGTFDNNTSGGAGISLNCAVGYELNWQGGRLKSTTDQGANAAVIFSDSPFKFEGYGGTNSISNTKTEIFDNDSGELDVGGFKISTFNPHGFYAQEATDYVSNGANPTTVKRQVGVNAGTTGDFSSIIYVDSRLPLNGSYPVGDWPYERIYKTEEVILAPAYTNQFVANENFGAAGDGINRVVCGVSEWKAAIEVETSESYQVAVSEVMIGTFDLNAIYGNTDGIQTGIRFRAENASGSGNNHLSTRGNLGGPTPPEYDNLVGDFTVETAPEGLPITNTVRVCINGAYYYLLASAAPIPPPE